MTARATLSSTFKINVPESVRTAQDWRVGQEFILIPKGTGILVIPAPDLNDLRGKASGANSDNYRERKDRL